MTLRAILADDEELSLDMLRVLLEETASGVEVIATCGTGEETLARAEELKPDLIFLDVNMPALNGMEVAAALRRSDEPRPMVVFTTAHAEFAAEAFDVEAIDYLMKPIQAERLARAMERVKHAQTDASEKMIPVPVLGGVELVELKSIEWVEANRDYLSLSSGGRSFMIRKTLAAFANETFPELRQSHRSYLVNPRLVKKVIPKPKGEAVLCFSSGKQVPVSRGYKDILADIISPGA